MTEQMTSANDKLVQQAVCRRLGATFLAAPEYSKVGIALQTLGALPIHGLRTRPAGDTTGWYLWAGGEMGEDDDFFQPLHVAHLEHRCPEVLPYLGLEPGWRFVIAPNYEDVWFDAAIIHE